MKYNAEEQKKINDWLVSVGVPYLKDEEFYEFKNGQLLEIVEAQEDSIVTWDEWQHLQNMMGIEIPLNVANRFVRVLWENDIEVLELATDRSVQCYKERNEVK